MFSIVSSRTLFRYILYPKTRRLNTETPLFFIRVHRTKKNSRPGTQNASFEHQALGIGLPRRSIRAGPSIRARFSCHRSEEFFIGWDSAS